MDRAEQVKLNKDFVDAAEKGALSDMQRLFAQGASANALDRHGNTGLIWAARREDAEMIAFLAAQKAETACYDESGKTPLMIVLEKKNEALACKMLSLHFNTAAQDDNKDTAAHYAAKGDMPVFIAQMQAQGLTPNLDIPNKNGDTPLMRAVTAHAPQALSALLAANVALDTQNNEKSTALILATQSDNSAFCAQLIEAGADTSLTNNRSLDAKTQAEVRSNKGLAQEISEKATEYAVQRFSEGTKRAIKPTTVLRIRPKK